MRGWWIAGVVGLGLGLSAADASAALPEWQYVVPFEITENSGSNLDGIQVEVSVNTQALISAGHLEATGSDLRFAYDCAGDQLIEFWIEPATLNTSDTRIWLLLDLPANDATLIRMFHGNAPASSAVGTIDDIFDGPISATNQIVGGSTNPGSAANTMRGFAFTPQRNILVTEFGKNEPTGTTRSIRLWNEAAQSSIHEELVSGAASIYSYSVLADPMWLDESATYVLSVFHTVGDEYFFQQNAQISPDLVHAGMRFCNSCTISTYPNQNLGGWHYGYPDFRYYTKQEVSLAPTVDSTVSCVADTLCDSDCSATICGDTVVNTVAGEECDDGSVVDGDGCSSDCLLEVPGTSTGDVSSSGGESDDSGTEGDTASGDPTDTTNPTSGSPTSGSPTTGSETSGNGTSSGTATDGSPTSGVSSAGTGGIPASPTGGLGETGCGCHSNTKAPPPWAMLLVLLSGLTSRRRSASR